MGEPEGCDCAELCAMGPTCPGGMLAGLPDAGCWRTLDHLDPARPSDPGCREAPLDARGSDLPDFRTESDPVETRGEDDR